ncbi:MAG: glycoside hydrolase family 20 zincin-like fold domain-containing protein [Victivallaceae bacterium]|nr:glycoside hydrolase family 20 zincin-like fold domain-containing protein [Victivallaceae bacterium]
MKKMLSSLVAVAALCAGAETTVKMSSTNGLAINTTFCEVSFLSRVIAMKPPWVRAYFNNELGKDTVENSGSACSMKNTDTSEFELVKYTADVEKDGRVVVDLEGKMNSDEPAFLEYSALAIPGYVLANSDYEWAAMDGSTGSGHIDAAGSGEMPTYASDFKKLTVRAQVGTFVIEVLEGPGMSMRDRRVNVFAKQSCFWVGFYRADLSRKLFKSKIRVGFEVSPDLKVAKPLPEVKEPGFPISPATGAIPVNTDVSTPLIPAPQFTDGGSASALETLSIPEDSAWRVSAKDFSAHDLERLSRAVPRLLNLNGSATGKELVEIVEDPSIPDEGYLLDIAPAGVKIYASSARGAFYGLQTMRSLSHSGEYYCTRIFDYPDQKLRSIHLCLDAADRTYFDLVEKVFAPGKINAVVGEVEFVKWDATKDLGIQQKDGMSKAELAEFIKLCDDNFIDFIPLMQTLGHCGWLFQDGKNLDMAEDPETPYAYNVSNPKVYELTTAILDELFALGDFKYLHIGHDEVDMRGRYPYRPENVKKGMKNCVFDDIMFYYNYARKHGARIMMWHDMIMAPGESDVAAGGPPNNLSEIRKDLPKDVVICVWRYTGGSFPEFKLLKKEGFDTVGCSWYGKDNPEQLCEWMKRDGGMGLMVTTWAGYFGSKNLLRENFYQVEPYVRGAAWSWRTDRKANADYDYAEILCNLMLPPTPGSRSEREVDISAAANLDLSKENMPFMLCDDLNLGTAELTGKTNFKLPERNGRRAAIAFKSRLNSEFPAGPVAIMLNCKAKALDVLSTTMGLTPPVKTRIGGVKLFYADGTNADFPVRYGIETGTPMDDYNFYLRPDNCLTWPSGVGIGDKPYKMWSCRVVNPHPDKEISKVELSGSPDGFAFYVLGLTLED